MGINWTDLFPTKLSVAIFLGYMSLFVSQGILVTKSQDSNNSYSYNTVTVVLFTDVLKLTVSIILYCRENSLKHLLKEIIINLNVMRLYFIPAFLYCLYNNLSFINLSTFDPTTYYLLLQLRVVITGILFQSFLIVTIYAANNLLCIECSSSEPSITEEIIEDFGLLNTKILLTSRIGQTSINCMEQIEEFYRRLFAE